MRIFVTGATGFVGRALCRYMIDQGNELMCATRNGPPNMPAAHPRSPRVSWEGIPTVDGNTDWRLSGLRIDTIVHLAARVHVLRETRSNPLNEFRRVNVDGSLNLARQAAAAGVRRFVYISSIKVNGEGSRNAYRESDIPSPEDAYGISKWEAEQGLLAIAHETDMEVVIVRPPLVYGPGVKGNFSALVKLVKKGVPLPLGAVSNERSLVALDNLVDFIGLCADRDKAPRAANEIFLIADGESVSTSELLRRIAQAYHKKAVLIPVPVSWMHLGSRVLGKRALADRLLGDLTVDCTKARDQLGWTPVVSMDSQLQKMALDDSPA